MNGESRICAVIAGGQGEIGSGGGHGCRGLIEIVSDKRCAFGIGLDGQPSRRRHVRLLGGKETGRS